MKVLIDTDAFCKLGLAGLLTDAVATLGAQLPDCERLPALTHMLRRGSVPKRFGKENCESLLKTADAVPSLQPPTSEWLDRFLPAPGIDPGEAQLFSAAAEASCLCSLETNGLCVRSAGSKAPRKRSQG